jgi:hypothetical protein
LSFAAAVSGGLGGRSRSSCFGGFFGASFFSQLLFLLSLLDRLIGGGRGGSRDGRLAADHGADTSSGFDCGCGLDDCHNEVSLQI